MNLFKYLRYNLAHFVHFVNLLHRYLFTFRRLDIQITIIDLYAASKVKMKLEFEFEFFLRRDTYLNSSSSKRSMVQEEAMRTPCLLMIAARSMPRSSSLSIASRCPTVCEMGFKANWQSSLRLGRRTVNCGMPFTYSNETSSKGYFE